MFKTAPLFKSLSCGKQIALIAITWLSVQTALYLFAGIKPVIESLKYIRAAEHLLKNGVFPESRYFFYLTTTLVIALCLKMKTGFAGVVVIQLLVNFLATLQFYRSLSRIQTYPYSAFITTLLLITCLPFQSWNFYLYTESLFYSTILLFFSSCLVPPPLTGKTILKQSGWLLLAIVSRPLGILLVPGWILYLIAQTGPAYRRLLTVCFLLGIIVLLVVSRIILTNISDWQILKPYEHHYIICDMPTHAGKNLDYLKNKPPVLQLAHYIASYPAIFFTLAIKKLRAFFLLVRPYYGQLHNLYLLFLCALFYIPVLINCIHYYKMKRYSIHLFFSFLIIFSFCLAVCLQCDDYHNRFHNGIIPVFLFCGVFCLIENKMAPLPGDEIKRASINKTSI